MDTLRKLTTPKVRRYLYRVGNAAVLIATARGLVKGDESALWLLGLGALLGLADANVSDPVEDSDVEDDPDVPRLFR